MFAGGGLTWVETEVKRGAFALPPAPAGARPDLSDLSCRWTIAPASRGIVLSVIVAPRGDDPRFGALVKEIVAMAGEVKDGGRPVTVASLGTSWPSEGLALEAIANVPPGQSRLKGRLAAASQFLIGKVMRATGLKTKDFDAEVFVGDVAANADFRKFDDALRHDARLFARLCRRARGAPRRGAARSRTTGPSGRPMR